MASNAFHLPEPDQKRLNRFARLQSTTPGLLAKRLVLAYLQTVDGPPKPRLSRRVSTSAKAG